MKLNFKNSYDVITITSPKLRHNYFAGFWSQKRSEVESAKTMRKPNSELRLKVDSNVRLRSMADPQLGGSAPTLSYFVNRYSDSKTLNLTGFAISVFASDCILSPTNGGRSCGGGWTLRCLACRGRNDHYPPGSFYMSVTRHYFNHECWLCTGLLGWYNFIRVVVYSSASFPSNWICLSLDSYC